MSQLLVVPRVQQLHLVPQLFVDYKGLRDRAGVNIWSAKYLPFFRFLLVSHFLLVASFTCIFECVKFIFKFYLEILSVTILKYNEFKESQSLTLFELYLINNGKLKTRKCLVDFGLFREENSTVA